MNRDRFKVIMPNGNQRRIKRIHYRKRCAIGGMDRISLAILDIHGPYICNLLHTEIQEILSVQAFKYVPGIIGFYLCHVITLTSIVPENIPANTKFRNGLFSVQSSLSDIKFHIGLWGKKERSSCFSDLLGHARFGKYAVAISAFRNVGIGKRIPDLRMTQRAAAAIAGYFVRIVWNGNDFGFGR
jgi:hypothetical protein